MMVKHASNVAAEKFPFNIFDIKVNIWRKIER